MTTPQSAKAGLRSRLLADRASLPEPYREAASADVASRLLTLPDIRGCQAVLAYAPFGAEVDIEPVLQALIDQGVGVFLPWVEAETGALEIARVHDLEADLAPGWRGVREPKATSRRPARPDRVQAALVPGVAFDRQGRRLGYGGGHFDRLLARLPPGAPKIGVAFAAQIVAEVPATAHDVRMDLVVTEEAVLRCAG